MPRFASDVAVRYTIAMHDKAERCRQSTVSDGDLTVGVDRTDFNQRVLPSFKGDCAALDRSRRID